MTVTRARAWNDLMEYVDSDSLIKHSLAVEGAMKKMAEVYGENKEVWACCGLLHDIDFQKYEGNHPIDGANILKEKDYPETFYMAIMGHSDGANTPRETKMAKTLYAVDQLASFVVAVALVRPDKFDGLVAKSVNKKIKDKAFARAVDRDGLKKGAEELGEEFSVLLQHIIEGLTEREAELQGMGQSLL